MAKKFTKDHKKLYVMAKLNILQFSCDSKQYVKDLQASTYIS